MKLLTYSLLALVLSASAFAQSGHLLYSFDKQKGDGYEPYGGLIADSNGNFYGVTRYTNGNGGMGTVFELSPNAGNWTETTLYSFSYSEGAYPSGNLVLDSAGNLYGVTSNGGMATDTGCSVRLGGCGTVYELSPQGNGSWSYFILHSFDHTDGAAPRGGLIFDGAGNLYGVTSTGGGGTVEDYGTVFELSPGQAGWTLTTLHVFVNNQHQTDALAPNGNLVFDAAGNLYGTAQQIHYVFELSPGESGWTETLLPLASEAGTSPTSGLTIDSSGNLYGMTTAGGSGAGGTAFELSPGESGWTTTVLANFAAPYSSTGPLTLDSSGNLYGVMGEKCHRACSAVFELSNLAGSWTLTPLMGFPVNGLDGDAPNGGLLLDGSGNIYGTAEGGGATGGGSAFEIIP